MFQKIAEVDERIKNRTIIFSNLLFGLLNSQNEKSTSSDLLITGGDNMKYQGITIHRHKTCKTWYARYRKNGKQCYVSAKTQQECYDKLKVALKQKSKQEVKRLAEPKKKNVMTFIEWFNVWLKTYKIGKVKNTTIIDYQGILKNITYLHNLSLPDIKEIDINNSLNSIVKLRAKQKAYELINSLLSKALKNNLIQTNPLTDEKPTYKRKHGTSLSFEDQQKLENANNRDYFIFKIAMLQGLRKGEVLALTLNDFDFDNNKLQINKSLNAENKIDSTKNTYSNRIVPLFKRTIECIKALKLKSNEKRIFDITQKQCDNLFQKMKLELNLNQNYTIHSLRHTFITNLQEKNIPLHIIQSWVGHNIGSKVTNEIYTHTRSEIELKYFNLVNDK